MRRRLACLTALAWLVTAGPVLANDGDAKRGKYLFDAAGCLGCHTDAKFKGKPLAGGRRLKTPFGTYYSPNITPDEKIGIGKWTDADFIRALRLGVSPDGSHYFPVFPYPSYTGVTDRDLLDIKAYIFTTPPVSKANREHKAMPPFGSRLLLGPWKALNFTPGPFKPDPKRTQEWNRGAYLVRALGHCGECHSPRNLLGAIKPGMELAGTAQGPDGGVVPNITPDKKTGIGKWSRADLEDFLDSGMLPDGDFAGSEMGEVIDNSTSRLTRADRRAMGDYLRSIPPVENRIEAKKKKKK
jgi:mono/diheme cytochrome c family protein